MELLSVILARATAWVEILDLNPRGKVSYSAIVDGMVRRYGFIGYPQKPEDFDEKKGVKFVSGVDPNTELVIEQLVIYTHGILIDTRNSTQASKTILESTLQWATDELGLAYNPQSIRSWSYLSQLAFRSDSKLATLHPALERLCKRVTSSVSAISGEALQYEPTSISINYDLSARQFAYGYLSIQRRERIPFGDNQYFSDAPLPTDIHFELLRDFEKDISNEPSPPGLPSGKRAVAISDEV